MLATDRALLEQLLVDLHRASGSADLSQAAYVVHDGDPISKARARTTKFGSFTPKRTRDAERDLAWVLKASVPVRPFYANVALALVFYRSDRRVIDEDNLKKLFMDAGTQAQLWQDDCQVTRSLVLVELDAAAPRTLIGICPTTSSLDRTVPMKQRRGLLLPPRQVCIAQPRAAEGLVRRV